MEFHLEVAIFLYQHEGCLQFSLAVNQRSDIFLSISQILYGKLAFIDRIHKVNLRWASENAGARQSGAIYSTEHAVWQRLDYLS